VAAAAAAWQQLGGGSATMEMAAALWQQLGGRRFLQLGAGGAAVAAWSWQQCNRARAVAAATAEEHRLRAYQQVCRAGLQMPRDAPER
jgi:shikimate 5-dehydrogenase